MKNIIFIISVTIIFLYSHCLCMKPSSHTSSKNMPALISAILNDNPAAVKELLEAGLKPHNISYNMIFATVYAFSLHETSQHSCIKNECSLEIFDLLLQAESSVDILRSFSGEGETLLHVACNRGMIKAVEILLNHGASPFVKDQQGFTPFHNAAFYGHKEILSLLVNSQVALKIESFEPSLLQAKDLCTPVHKAIQSKDKDCLKIVLDFYYNKCNPHTSNNKGNTPLHYAVFSQNESILDLLANRSADLTAKNNTGETPLAMAQRLNSTDATYGNIILCLEEIARKSNTSGGSCIIS